MRASRKTKLRKKRAKATKKAGLSHLSYSDGYLTTILKEVRTIALIGASPKAERPSNQVLTYMLGKGYEVIPVNPGLVGQKIAGQTVYGALSEIDRPIDMVDIFRNSEAVLAIVEEALNLPQKPKVIWMQLGVEHEEASERAEANSIKVIMNRCPKIEYGRLFGELSWAGINSGVITSKRLK